MGGGERESERDRNESIGEKYRKVAGSRINKDIEIDKVALCADVEANVKN